MATNSACCCLNLRLRHDSEQHHRCILNWNKNEANMETSTTYSRDSRRDMRDSSLHRSQFDVHSLVLCILAFFFSHLLMGFDGFA
jgi:hypothetical protein